MGRLDGKVALVSGAARGQGRSHCIRLAEEGADIIAFDVCAEIVGAPYPSATRADLDETARAVEALGRRVIAAPADVRDMAAVDRLVDQGVTEFGRLDIVAAQAGLSHRPERLHALPDGLWHDMIDVTLTGTWNTVRAAVPPMLAGGRGGVIVVTGSVAALRGGANIGHYVTAKHGLRGMVKSLSRELGPERIRVNSLAPSNVATDMLLNQSTYNLFCPDRAPDATREEFEEVAKGMHALPVPYVDPIDVSNALVFLASDEARYITGVTLAVDAGSSQH